MDKVIDLTPQTDSRVYDSRPNGLSSLVGGAIVLHHTGGRDSRKHLMTFHSNPVSAHKLFAKDGTIYKLVPEVMRAWHAGMSIWENRDNWNNFSLGYEIENMGDGEDPFTNEQYNAVARSLAYDCALYHISDFWVQDHKTIAFPRDRKIDPKGWDHDKMWEIVEKVRANWPYSPIVELWSSDKEVVPV